MEVATYNRQGRLTLYLYTNLHINWLYSDGELLCNLDIETSTTFSTLRDRIEEEKGTDAEDQTLFLRWPAADSLSEVCEIRLEVDALNNWLVSDFKEFKILVDIPHAADKVKTDSEMLIVVGPDNKVSTLSDGDHVHLPSSGKLSILKETIEENGRKFHQVRQYKDNRDGILSIETPSDGSSFSVFFVSEDGTKDEDPLVPEIKDLEERERRNWTQTGENIKEVFCFVCELITLGSRPIISLSSGIASIITDGQLKCLESKLKISSFNHLFH